MEGRLVNNKVEMKKYPSRLFPSGWDFKIWRYITFVQFFKQRAHINDTTFNPYQSFGFLSRQSDFTYSEIAPSKKKLVFK